MADINALAAAILQAVQAAAAVPPPQAAVDRLSPYDGDALDLSSRQGSSLFQDACKPLTTTFDGKPEQLPGFINDLAKRATFCRWNHPNHDILTINGHNVLEDYGVITLVHEQATQAVRNTDRGDLRVRQNALMMYQCINGSITDDAKAQIIGQTITKDGPTIFYLVVKATFTATFSHAQSTREKLMNLSPKKYKYDILKINDFICLAFQAINSATPTNPITDQEKFYCIFRVYKQIKTPSEWLAHIQFLENNAVQTQNFTPISLINSAAAKSNVLKDQGHWKPSDSTVEEQILLMMTQLKGKGKGDQKSGKQNSNKPDKKDGDGKDQKEKLPFATKPGKLGDTKKHKGKMYYYCPGEHKAGHWVRHDPKDCDLAKKAGNKKGANDSNQTKGTQQNKNNKQVKVDADKRRAAIAEIEKEGADVETSAKAILAMLTQTDE